MEINRYNEKISSGCAISGIFDKKKNRFSGTKIVNSIAVMHERSNGLGGGFAAYGIYPERKNEFAFHIFYDSNQAKKDVEDFLYDHFQISISEEIPTREQEILSGIPIIWRYFAKPDTFKIERSRLSDSEYVIRCVININENYEGAYVVSSGKNMGVFKGVGYPEDIAEFYKLENYKAYLWTAHGRFPTNTPGWWGGAHPFTLLTWSIVHNGEISSYGANKRYVEMFGYKCTMKTDTEVITYLFDLLIRKHGLAVKQVVKALTSPLWSEIEFLDKKEKKIVKTIRTVYGSAMLNGPFSIILGHKNGFLVLNDRIKLRPVVVATKGEKMYVASEEAAIREICKKPEDLWAPRGGEPVIGLVKGVDEL